MDRNPDLLLIHPPSVYDFRRRGDLLFPPLYNTVVNVSPMFEIFPLGFYALKSYLEERGIRAAISNLAGRMIKDWELNVEDYLRARKPRLFGIDLFWLVHAQGALEICRIIKEVHRGKIPVLLGGITASYYFKELAEHACVDFVIRGNVPFRPLEMLMRRLIDGRHDFAGIPDLCYKKNGRPVCNSAAAYGKKYLHPIRWDMRGLSRRNMNFAMANPQSGCRYDCCFCSGARSAVRRYALQKQTLMFRPSEAITRELDSLRISAETGGGKKIKLILVNHWHEHSRVRRVVLRALRKRPFCSSVHISLFGLMPAHIVKEITRSVSPVLEISPQSHDARIRRCCSQAGYTNKEFESWITEVLEEDVKRIEVYFMIGLPGQTFRSVHRTVDYCEYLMRKFGHSRRVVPFIGSMIPFLDPGSPAFEDPDRFGYRVLYRTLEEHCRALTEVSFEKRLNYETRWMSRAQIVEAACEAARRLTRAKVRFGYLTLPVGHDIISRLDLWSRSMREMKRIDLIRDPRKRERALRKTGKKVRSLNKKIIRGKFCDQIPAGASLYNAWYEI